MESKFSKENPAAGNSGLYQKKFTSKYTKNQCILQSAINFERVKQKAMPHILTLLNRMLPDGKIQGHEYVARNPRRHDRTPGSFKFNTRTGRWGDFATKDIRGIDIISLWAYVYGLSQINAAKEILAIVGDA